MFNWWSQLRDLFRCRLREKNGRHKHLMASCLNRQSVKCTAVPSVRGFDAGKLINGRKRHIAVVLRPKKTKKVTND